MPLGDRLISVFVEEVLREYIEPLWKSFQGLEYRMTSAEDTLTQFVNSINEETNLIAQRLDDLMAQVGNSSEGVSSDQLNAVLGPVTERLKGLGTDGATNVPTDDPTTTTDPTNSPTADSPAVNPAPDAPTESPTPDPTVNPVDVPADSQPADDGSTTSGASVVDTTSSDASTSTDSSATTTSDTTTTSPTPTDSTTTTTTTTTSNTNDFREDL